MKDLSEYEEKLADQYYRNFMEMPDWHAVVSEINEDQIVDLFKLIILGCPNSAYALAGKLLDKAAHNIADTDAAREVNRMYEDQLVKDGFK